MPSSPPGGLAEDAVAAADGVEAYLGDAGVVAAEAGPTSLVR